MTSALMTLSQQIFESSELVTSFTKIINSHISLYLQPFVALLFKMVFFLIFSIISIDIKKLENPRWRPCEIFVFVTMATIVN